MNKTLSPREVEVVRLVAAGRSNREVAESLKISYRTAEAHRSRAMLKLNISSLAALVRYALRERLIDASEP